MRNRFVAIFLALVLVTGATPALASEDGTSALAGKLIGPDGEPLAGAVLVAYHLSSEAVFRSEPTGRGGDYRIDGVPYGYFDLAIETADGLYVADQVVNVPPSGKATLTLEVTATGVEARAFPGSDSPPSGIATVSKKLSGRDFWRSPKGVAIIAGGAGAALLLLAAGGGSDDEPIASPVNP